MDFGTFFNQFIRFAFDLGNNATFLGWFLGLGAAALIGGIIIKLAL